jgi:hypothetical protein
LTSRFFKLLSNIMSIIFVIKLMLNCNTFQRVLVYNFHVILLRLMLLHPFFQILYFKAGGAMCRVAAVNKLPRSSLQCCYIYLVFGIIESTTFCALKIEYRSSRCQGRDGCFTFSFFPHVQTNSNQVWNVHVILLR